MHSRPGWEGEGRTGCPSSSLETHTWSAQVPGKQDKLQTSTGHTSSLNSQSGQEKTEEASSAVTPQQPTPAKEAMPKLNNIQRWQYRLHAPQHFWKVTWKFLLCLSIKIQMPCLPSSPGQCPLIHERAHLQAHAAFSKGKTLKWK